MIRVENIEKYYNRGKKNENHVLKTINLEFPDSGLICITGESGCGKTSLMNAIGGLDVFQKGRVIYEGKHVLTCGHNRMEQYRNQKIGYVFQNYYLIADQTVGYNVELALKLCPLPEDEVQERVDAVLDAVGMKRYKHKLVSHLSGGQKQRVSIARALVKNPDIIFADEPTGNLDEKNTIRVMNILKMVSKQCLVVLVSHEPDMVQCFGDRIIRMVDGEVVSDEENVSDGMLRRLDHRHIYLQDMTVKEVSVDGLDIQVFEEQGVPRNGRVQMAWKDGKIYIQGLEETEIVVAGEDAGCEMIEGKRPDWEDIRELEEEFSMDSLSGGHGGKLTMHQSLSVEKLLRMVQMNLKYFGRKRIILNIVLGIATLLLMVTLTDLLQQNSIDRQAVQQTDSHMVTLKVEPENGKNSTYFVSRAGDFYTTALLTKGYTDISADANVTLNIHYAGYPQLEGSLCKVDGFSTVSLREIGEEDLECGRMPEKRNEIVMDRWLLQRCRNEENILKELIQRDESVLNLKATVASGGTEFTIVGVSKTDEPTVYVSDSAILGFSYDGYKVMTIEELRQTGLQQYSKYPLSGRQFLVSGKLLDTQGGEKPKEELLNEINNDFGGNCKIKGYFREDLGVDYVVSEQMLQEIVKTYVINARRCKFYAEDPDAAVSEIKRNIKMADSSLKISAVHSSKEQLKAYQAEHKSTIRISHAVTLAMVLICLLMIYFTVRSNVLGRWEELTVYRLLGIRLRDIMKIYALEMAWISLCVCCPVVLICWGIVSYVTAIPSLEIYVYFPLWSAVLLSALLVACHALISVLPVAKILSKTPVELMRE
ncbi:MAG: ABC transporter ATP-binding protein/permease [Lachnospiraceae bacterium]|nr:ABC transporter ATP-binding protein/permease [Lachnospiraceae bacterium]